MSNVHHARLVSRALLADAIYELGFETVDEPPLAFRAGQFISVRVGVDAAGDPILRSYSIASSSGAPRLLLVVRLIPGGVASEMLGALALGDVVRFTGPMGFFVLDLQHNGDVVFGATGTGIAPVLPMLDELLARPNEQGRIHVFWGNRHAADLFWQAELAARVASCARLTVRTFVSQPETSAPSSSGAFELGRISQPLLEMVKQLDKPVFYLVGNGAMIKEVKTALQAQGIDRRKQIRNEAFFG